MTREDLKAPCHATHTAWLLSFRRWHKTPPSLEYIKPMWHKGLTGDISIKLLLSKLKHHQTLQKFGIFQVFFLLEIIPGNVWLHYKKHKCPLKL